MLGPQDLQNKLNAFKDYYNQDRVHYSLQGRCPNEISHTKKKKSLDIKNYSWQLKCDGQYELLVSA